MKTITLFLIFLIAFATSGLSQNKPVDRDSRHFTIVNAERQSGLMRVTVYPNPNRGSFYVKVSGFENRPVIEIYNLDAEVIVYQGKLIYTTNKINLSRYAQGVYVYRVYAPYDGTMVATGKITVQ